MITHALFVRMEAKTGREEEVEDFLRSALDPVDAEDGTPLWFGLRLGPSTFGIFDAFPSDEARDAHLSGQVASTLMEKAPELLAGDPRSSAWTCSPARSTCPRSSRSSNSRGRRVGRGRRRAAGAHRR